MRNLLIFRGLPGCGKSTFIEKHNLKPYTLSADDIRLMLKGPQLDANGVFGISQNDNKAVWSMLYKILEERMINGDFCVVDSTNANSSDMKSLKELASKYRYRIYCVDMTDVPFDEVKRRNAMRDEYKRVPEYVIDKMYEKMMNQPIPSGIKVIKPEEIDTIWYRPVDMSKWNKIHFIGDVHGCYTALKEMLGELKDDEYYVFTGDYYDRGLENAETMNYLFSIMDRPNVYFLEGNHEIHAWKWANNKPSMSPEFERYTKPQFEAACLSKSKMREFYRKLGQCAYYTYNGQQIFACHGGLSKIPENLTLISTNQLIKGSGGYKECVAMENSFAEKSGDVIMVHGHRNYNDIPVKAHDNVYNLENSVEFGGTLRCVTFSKDGDVSTKEIKNTVFRIREKPTSEPVKDETIHEMLTNLRANEYVKEKQFGDISSFNFNREAFQKGVWDKQTVRARGLFVDTKNEKIVARSYEKFFRVNERPETTMDALKESLKFPVCAYKKENGYLGIFSCYEDKPFFTTKSSVTGDYNEWFKEIAYKQYGAAKIESLKNYASDYNCTFVFEVIDVDNDPHIIEYENSKIILLDIIYNEIDFRKMPYDELCKVANEFGVEVKTLAYELKDWTEFEGFVALISDDKEYINGDGATEGYVFEDSNGFMVKIKTEYYNFWKHMRSVTASVMKSGKVKDIEKVSNRVAAEYYTWIQRKYNNDEYYEADKIIALRKMFINEHYIAVLRKEFIELRDCYY